MICLNKWTAILALITNLVITNQVLLATQELKDDAEHGNAQAQLKLGLMYLNGQGTDKNINRARELLEYAATQEVAEAQFELGNMYWCERSDDKVSIAIEYYKQAAQNGHIDAQRILGDTYTKGHDATKDILEGFRWYVKSAQGSNYFKQDTINIVNFVSFLSSEQDQEQVRNDCFQLKENFTQTSGMFQKRKIINSGDHSYADKKLAFPYLKPYYEKIFGFNLTLLDIIKAYDSPGFMISCFEPKSSTVVDGFNTSISQEIKYYNFDNKHFLSFGFENIKNSDEMIKIINKELDSSDLYKKISDLINLLKGTKFNILSKAHNFQQQSIFGLNPNMLNENVEELFEKYTICLTDIDEELCHLDQLLSAPQTLKTFLTNKNHIAYRNQKFLEAYPGIKSVFN